MGQSNSKLPSATTSSYAEAFGRFNESELRILLDLFASLAARCRDVNENENCGGDGGSAARKRRSKPRDTDWSRLRIDKATFLTLFDLPGLLGERLFAVFDRKRNQKLDFEEFIFGLSRFARGNAEERLEFVWRMWSFDHGRVTEVELRALLCSLVSACYEDFEAADLLRDGNPDTTEDDDRGVRADVRADHDDMDEDEGADADDEDDEGDEDEETADVDSDATEVLSDVDDQGVYGQNPLRDLPLTPRKVRNMSYEEIDDEVLRERIDNTVDSFMELAMKHSIQGKGPLAPRILTFRGFVAWAKECPFVVDMVREAFALGHHADELEESVMCIDDVGGGQEPFRAYKARPRRRSRSPASALTQSLSSLIGHSRRASQSEDEKGGFSFEERRTSSRASSVRNSSHNLLFLDKVLSSSAAHGSSSAIDQVSGSTSGIGTRNASVLGASERFELVCRKCKLKLANEYCYVCGRHTEGKSTCGHCGRLFQQCVRFCPVCGDQLVDPRAHVIFEREDSHLPQPQRSDEEDDEHKRRVPSLPKSASLPHGLHLQHHHHGTTFCGHLTKHGRRTGKLTTRWFVVRDAFLYAFKHEEDVMPQHVWHLRGAFLEVLRGDERRGHFGFMVTWHTGDVSPGETTTDETESDFKSSKRLYARTAREREQWLEVLRAATQTESREVSDLYDVRGELGSGKFSTVRECVCRQTGRHYAIKMINRRHLTTRERDALRTEIAVLKLVHHPHIVHIRHVFENRHSINIVMDLVQGGDLFDRIVQRRRFDEWTARAVLFRILDVVKYLHDRGIVHRDLKPENIMVCDRNRDDAVVVGDFGLSRFAAPEEMMRMACGTLAYVAPEVLQNRGYGQEVDLWSCGVILYVMLRGRLPFEGQRKKDIIAATLAAKIDLSDRHWQKVSPEAKQLLKCLLHADPQKRCTAEQALAHPWFLQVTLPAPYPSAEWPPRSAARYFEHTRSHSQLLRRGSERHSRSRTMETPPRDKRPRRRVKAPQASPPHVHVGGHHHREQHLSPPLQHAQSPVDTLNVPTQHKSASVPA